jgi:hypothetical protein
MTRDDVVRQICDEAWSFRTDVWDQAVNQIELQPWIESWNRFFPASTPVGDQVEDQAKVQAQEDNYDAG